MTRAEELRLAFDRSFAEGADTAARSELDLIAIQAGGQAYAIPLAEIAAIHADVVIAPVPTLSPELIGIAAVRSALVPVYDLRRVLGVSTDASPRWIVLAAAWPAAYAFDGFEGLVRLPGGIPANAEAALVRASFEDRGRTRFVVDLSVVDSQLRQRSRKES